MCKILNTEIDDCQGNMKVVNVNKCEAIYVFTQMHSLS